MSKADVKKFLSEIGRKGGKTKTPKRLRALAHARAVLARKRKEAK